MGWGAAHQYAEDMGMEPEEAYQVLYAHRESPAAPRKPYSCPVCGKRKATVLAVLQHAHESHHKVAHIEAVAAWWVDRAKEKAQREPGQ